MYVHVPLCRSKCAYCDFFSVASGDIDRGAEVLTATMFAALAWCRSGLMPAPLDTLYIGGGTPTMLDRYLCLLIGELRSSFPLAEGAEVTVEANPDSLTLRLARDLRGAGVTRLSLGVQSLDDAALRWLGRPHDAGQAIDAMLAASAAGLDLSVDLMCGIPGVSRALWRASLEAVAECGATHVSVYPLSVEDGTPLADDIRLGRRSVPTDDETADEMLAACEVLGSLGFVRYETANYALPGHESRHNIAYWTGRPYLGIGGGAHGMLDPGQARAAGLISDADDVGRLRYAYPRQVIPEQTMPIDFERLSAAEARREDAMLGMRMSCGIDEELAASAGVIPALRSLVEDGLVEHRDGRWYATERGWLLGNEIFGRLWHPGD